MYYIYYTTNLDDNAVVNMNLPSVDNSSLWILKDKECTLNGGSSSPYFVPKVNNITIEYDSVLSNSISTKYFFFYYVTLLLYIITLIHI
jgi:hypothetical protein